MLQQRHPRRERPPITNTMTPQLVFYVLAILAIVFVLGPDTKPPRINRRHGS